MVYLLFVPALTIIRANHVSQLTCSCFTPVTTQLSSHYSNFNNHPRTVSRACCADHNNHLFHYHNNHHVNNHLYNCRPVVLFTCLWTFKLFSSSRCSRGRGRSCVFPHFFTTPYPSALSACASTCGQEIDYYMFYFYGTSSTYTCTGVFPWFSPLMSSYANEYVPDAPSARIQRIKFGTTSNFWKIGSDLNIASKTIQSFFLFWQSRQVLQASIFPK